MAYVRRKAVQPESVDRVSDGTIGMVIFIDNKPIQFSFEGSQLRGTIPASKLNAKDLRALVMPALARLFGRLK